MIQVACPNCRQNVSVEDALAGRRTRCPKCNGIVNVPPPSEPAQADPSANQASASQAGAFAPWQEDDDLEYSRISATDETDILPAMQSDQVIRRKQQLGHKTESRADRKPRSRPLPVYVKAILGACILIIVAGAVIVSVAWVLRKM